MVSDTATTHFARALIVLQKLDMLVCSDGCVQRSRLIGYTSVARHSAERLSAQTVAWILLVGLAVFGIDMGMTDFFQRLFMELPNSRTQEHEGQQLVNFCHIDC